ncbi:hypothetical protein GCM10022258_06670 [Aquimarina gracilis]
MFFSRGVEAIESFFLEILSLDMLSETLTGIIGVFLDVFLEQPTNKEINVMRINTCLMIS